MASNHNSILGENLWWTDPLALAFGKDSGYTDTIHGSIPTELNRIGSDIVKPFAEVDKAINPARQIGIVDDISTWTENKPADALGMFFGAAYGAPALGSALGGTTGGTGMGSGINMGSISTPASGSMGSGINIGSIANPSTGAMGSGTSLGGMQSSAPAVTGMDWSSIGGDVMTNAGSSLLSGLLAGGGGRGTVSGGNAGSGGIQTLDYILNQATNVRPAGQRGGFQ
ncbi:hypothetical protein BCU90_17385 [Vibrio lentus]|uniref:hypothetical protein n=1 Tax=Vibrio lentus TaxID=136468 RepID=UPI000C82E933|nr:hypothetical protein [Vibrio lentus]PMG45637.1 hypothetical protein BCU90_17385 [Vibrio lentus]